MFIQNYKEPESSFLSVEKDTAIILDSIFKNENLNRLLYYDTSDALKKPRLTDEQKLEVQKNNIKLVPTIKIDNTVKSYINIIFGKFSAGNNPQFRDNVISFDILCHLDDWELDDLKLRPYRIAAELDSMFRNIKLTGMGELNFMGADVLMLNDILGGVTLLYQAVHGGEDHKKPVNPVEEDDINENFDKVVNHKFDELEDEWTID